ncbi:MAG: Mur ligase family protein [Candidatus Poseidoniales archaeon]|nr:Mur ligase family protein [Candidatus Poseidoniales archaeon]
MSDDVWSWLESLKAHGYNASLDNTATLLSRLDMPQHAFPAVHVAGSNGKGTCCAILANAFTLSGKCTGLFTSPHLMSVNERVRIDGSPIPDVLFEDCLKQIQDACNAEPPVSPTFYEATFLVAMLAFRDQGVERAVIETGLGGRLDATRLVDADCCILTEISLEHTEFLGETLAEIAEEKVAIVRQGRPLIATWPYDNSARKAIERAVRDHDEAWWWRGDRRNAFKFSEAVKAFRPLSRKTWYDGWMPYQQEAAMLAKSALSVMGSFYAYDEIEQAVTHTNWPGRMQWLDVDGISFLLDCAHNPSGMARACEQIRFQKSRDMSPMPGIIVLGCTTQTDLGIFIQPLVELIVEGKIGHVFVTQPPDGRKIAVDCEELASVLEEQGIDASISAVRSISDAISSAKNKATELDPDLPQPILCIGSIYLIGEVLSIIDEDGEMDFQNILTPPKGIDGVDPIP